MGDGLDRRLVLRAAPDAELAAARLVERIGARVGFPRDTLAEIKVAVVEACLNALEYGNGRVDVHVAAHAEDPPWIEVTVTDNGPGFDPASVTRPDLRQKLHEARKRGWGLELIRHFMDSVEISSRPGATEIRMRRSRGGG